MSQSAYDRAARLRREFLQVFGRDMTAEEARLLLLADTVSPTTDIDETDDDAEAAKAG